MSLLLWLVFGLVAGTLAECMLPREESSSLVPGELALAITVGVIAAIVSGIFATALGFGAMLDLSLGSVAFAVFGSTAVLIVWTTLRWQTAPAIGDDRSHGPSVGGSTGRL